MEKQIFSTLPLLPTLSNSEHEKNTIGRISAENMMGKLQYIIDLKVHTILDVGSGVGLDILCLNNLFSPVTIIANDISTEAIQKIKQKYCMGFQNFLKKIFKKIHVIPLCSDLKKLPIPDNTIDLIWCNMVLPHVPLHSSFQEFLRILKPGGLLLFSTLGKNTLIELQHALINISHPQHWNMPDIQSIADILSRTGYQNIVMDVDQYSYTYPYLFEMIRDIPQHNFHLPITLSITQLKKLIRYYNQTYLNKNLQNTQISASIEILYGQCWKDKKSNKVSPIKFHRNIPHNDTIFRKKEKANAIF